MEIEIKLEQIISALNGIESLILESKKFEKIFFDNQEFCQLMNISKRTAQNWRDSGIVSYSQIGAKLYYSMSDIQQIININHVKSLILKK